MHIKEPLLLIDKSRLCGGSGFPFSLSEWSLTILYKGRMEMFYLMTHPTHFVYGYMALDIW